MRKARHVHIGQEKLRESGGQGEGACKARKRYLANAQAKSYTDIFLFTGIMRNCGFI